MQNSVLLVILYSTVLFVTVEGCWEGYMWSIEIKVRTRRVEEGE